LRGRADGWPLSALLGRRQLGLRLGDHLLAAMRVGLRPGLLLDLGQLLARLVETSRANSDYLSVKLDDPSFPAPIFANPVCVFHGIVGRDSTGTWARFPRDRGQSFHAIVGALD